jgi:hypothetical protein
MIIKEHRCTRIQLPVRVFELLITPGKLYPVVCVGVKKGARRKHFALDQVGPKGIEFDENISFQIDLNGPPDPPPSLSPDANELTLNKNENDKSSANEQEIQQPQLNVTALRQIARDVLLICIESWLLFFRSKNFLLIFSKSLHYKFERTLEILEHQFAKCEC